MSQLPRATIHLSNIVANWRALDGLHPGATTSAVVKADAYGLGAGPVSRALMRAESSAVRFGTSAANTSGKSSITGTKMSMNKRPSGMNGSDMMGLRDLGYDVIWGWKRRIVRSRRASKGARSGVPPWIPRPHG